MRHGTVRVFVGDLHEFLLGFFVPERVQQGDAAREWLLRRRRAGDGEMDRAELCLGEIFVMVVIFVFVVVGEGGERKKTG